MDGGAEYFRYEGPTGTTREFCQFRVGKIYHISEIRKMTSPAGLMVIYYGGGYNCRHRFVAWFGKVEGGVFIHESHEDFYKSKSKAERKILDDERRGAEMLSKYGQVELNGLKADSYKKEITDKDGKKRLVNDVDLFFEGSAANLKRMEATDYDCLADRLHDSNRRKQADTVIIIAENELKDEDESIKRAERWLLKHENKRLFLYNRIKDKFMEVKP